VLLERRQETHLGASQPFPIILSASLKASSALKRLLVSAVNSSCHTIQEKCITPLDHSSAASEIDPAPFPQKQLDKRFSQSKDGHEIQRPIALFIAPPGLFLGIKSSFSKFARFLKRYLKILSDQGLIF